MKSACIFVSLAILLVAASLYSSAQSAPVESSFIVLRTDRVVVPTGESTHLNCSIIGVGNAAQINCDSHTSPNGFSRVYQVALVVGSNRVGYIVSCGGGLLHRIGCTALTPGQVLNGSVSNGKMSLIEGDKTKKYRVETSAYIGSLESQSVSEPSAAPPPKAGTLSVSQSSAKQVTPSQAESTGSSTDAATVHITSSPSGGEIYIDGKFFGNTPSDVKLNAGEHLVKITLAGKDWSRTIQITSGEINLHAEMPKEP